MDPAVAYNQFIKRHVLSVYLTLKLTNTFKLSCHASKINAFTNSGYDHELLANEIRTL